MLIQSVQCFFRVLSYKKLKQISSQRFELAFSPLVGKANFIKTSVLQPINQGLVLCNFYGLRKRRKITDQFSPYTFLRNYGKTIIIISGKKCLWYSNPKIVSFSVKKESVKFYSTDPRSSAVTTWLGQGSHYWYRTLVCKVEKGSKILWSDKRDVNSSKNSSQQEWNPRFFSHQPPCKPMNNGALMIIFSINIE